MNAAQRATLLEKLILELDANFKRALTRTSTASCKDANRLDLEETLFADFETEDDIPPLIGIDDECLCECMLIMVCFKASANG